MTRKRALVAAAALIAVAAAAMLFIRREPEGPGAGIPLDLADDRAARVSNLRYDVALRVPASADEPVRGRVEASFTLADAARPLAFDFAQPADRVASVTANGRSLTPRIEAGHIVVPAGALGAGANTVAIEFTAGDEALNRHDDFLYSLFVPARASLTLPCFDQPNLKARWRLTLDVPEGWEAVSNGRQTGRVTRAGATGFLFDETEPIPTYLFAFAAGRFRIETAERAGRGFRMFHRETDEARLARNREAIFDLHARALAWLETYTAIPYPFGKFDFVLIPSFQFGGMEHPGAIFYNATSLLLDETATQNQHLGRASLIAHETAHMWFGDLVTMRWFDDVWMKEVFANFMAAKIVNPSFPEVNHELRFHFAHYPAAYEVDRTEGANPIRQPLANLHEAGSLYGAIIYQKAPVVMRQLERLMGEEAMRDGLREYLARFAMGNAAWPDLVAVLDPRTPEDLQAWSRAWVEEAGRPSIRAVVEAPAGRIVRLSLRQHDPRGRELVWPQRLVVLVAAGGAIHRFPVALGAGDTDVVGAVGLPAPAWVLPSGDGLGYGNFELDPAGVAALAAALPDLPDALTRGAALVSLRECLYDGRIAPARVVDAVLAALPRETDELVVQQLLGTARTLFWRFTGADDRAALARRLEPALQAGLARAATTSRKAAWFGALRGVALQPDTVDWLAKVWRREVKIPGLPLAEADEADLALDLAVRDVPDAGAMLAAQLERFTNPDRKARFAFVIPAVSADAAVRERFFEGLKDVANRRREAWVLEAAGYLHHPLRAAASRKLIRPALELVPEIRRTGDIFFPKRWADATLGGYQSVQTAADVRAFIDALPADYPPRLRWVLLSAADPLFRAARVLNQM